MTTRSTTPLAEALRLSAAAVTAPKPCPKCDSYSHQRSTSRACPHNKYHSAAQREELKQQVRRELMLRHTKQVEAAVEGAVHHMVTRSATGSTHARSADIETTNHDPPKLTSTPAQMQVLQPTPTQDRARSPATFTGDNATIQRSESTEVIKLRHM